jgi:homoserine kinase
MIARVPATSANMGPGFDALAMALTLWAEIGTLDEEDEVPEGGRAIDEHHPASEAFRAAGGEGALWERSRIPMARGLGYSAAVRVGAIALAVAQREGADAVHDGRDEIVRQASALEGHADNAAAAVYGGVVTTTGDVTVPVPMHLDPAVVVWVPSATTRTDRSRAALSPTVPRDDATFNIARTAMLVAALASGDAARLRDAVADRLHQDVRFALAPASQDAWEAAVGAGAWCAWLSGSGPAVVALCAAEAAERIGDALPSDGRVKVLRVDHDGLVVEP